MVNFNLLKYGGNVCKTVVISRRSFCKGEQEAVLYFDGDSIQYSFNVYIVL
jgi:hypothetical protein